MHSLQTIKSMNEKAEKVWKDKATDQALINQQDVLDAITLALQLSQSDKGELLNLFKQVLATAQD